MHDAVYQGLACLLACFASNFVHLLYCISFALSGRICGINGTAWHGISWTVIKKIPFLFCSF